MLTVHRHCCQNQNIPNLFSGEWGIRPPGPLSGPTVFKTAAINHSATSPNYKVHLFESNKIKPFYICCTNLYISSVIKITKKNFLLSLLTFVPPEGLEPPTRWGCYRSTYTAGSTNWAMVTFTIVLVRWWEPALRDNNLNYHRLGSSEHHHFIGVVVKVAI